MLLRLLFLESKSRRKLFDIYPPKTVCVFSNRIECAKDGIFTNQKAIAYAWFVWVKGYKGDTVIKWIDAEQEQSEHKQMTWEDII